MKKYVTLIVVTLLFISQGILSNVSAQWIPYEIDTNTHYYNANRVADMDDDGDADIISVFYIKDAIFWYENENLTWKQHTIKADIDGPIWPLLADIDDDGDLDVVIQGNEEHKVFWYENNLPDTVWTEHIIDPFLNGAEFVAVADFDDDDDLDVAAVGWLSDRVVWYENNNLSWNKYIIDNRLDGAATLVVSDIDDDGDPDVVASGSEADDVVWYENTLPDSNWNKHDIDANLDRAFSINVADIDGDGDIDVAAPGRDADVVKWYENDNLSWIPHIIDDKFDGPTAVHIVDINGDSLPDFLAEGDNPHLKLYTNNNQIWEENIIFSSNDPVFSGVGDIDGDGLPDLIATDKGTGIFRWYHNKPTVAQAKSIQSWPTFIPTDGKTLNINAQLFNPENHPVSVQAIISGEQNAYTDSIQLYDDGLHSDSLASDNIYGNSKWLSDLEEDIYSISISTYDIVEDYPYTLPSTTSFTTIGPLEIDSVSAPTFSDFTPNRGTFYVYIKNTGQTTTAEDVSVSLYPDTTDLCLIGLQIYREFGDIEPGQRASGRFTMTIDTTCLSDTIFSIPFTANIASGGHVYWTDISGEVLVDDIAEFSNVRPGIFRLNQNYPNPFNPRTIINYELPITNYVDLSIYNLLGQKVATLVSEKQNAGFHEVDWDASGFASGVYYYRIEAGEFQDVKKMIVLR